MSLTTRHYVTFSIPGTFVDRMYTVEISPSDRENIEVPDGINCYYFFDVDMTEASDGTRLSSEKKNISPTFYVDACPLTRDELMLEIPGVTTLLGSNQSDGWQRVVRLRSGEIQAVKCEDVLI